MYTLTDILHTLLYHARKTPGIKYASTLRGGLQITVMIYNGETWVALARPRVLPSITEVKTICNHWPEAVPANRVIIKDEAKNQVIVHWLESPIPIVISREIEQDQDEQLELPLFT